jgi:general secretion pathway protein G
MKKNKKKRPLTLLEIMIVIFLIGIIGSVVGYNMKGSLDKGRAFKTERAMDQIHDILMLEVAQGGCTLKEAIENPLACLKRSGIAKDPEKLVTDGWGQAFELKERFGDISVRSQPYKNYLKKHDKTKADAIEADEKNDTPATT